MHSISIELNRKKIFLEKTKLHEEHYPVLLQKLHTHRTLPDVNSGYHGTRHRGWVLSFFCVSQVSCKERVSVSSPEEKEGKTVNVPDVCVRERGGLRGLEQESARPTAVTCVAAGASGPRQRRDEAALGSAAARKPRGPQLEPRGLIRACPG